MSIDYQSPTPVTDLINWNTDRSVNPPVMLRGMMTKTGSSWSYWDGGVNISSAVSSIISSPVSANVYNVLSANVYGYVSASVFNQISATVINSVSASIINSVSASIINPVSANIYNTVSATVSATTPNGITIYDTNTSAGKGLKFNAEAPQVCAQDYGWALAEGDIAGHTTWSKIGFTTPVSANVQSDIWSYNGTYVFPTSGMQMAIKSSNDNDIRTGAGAVSATVHYLDSTWTEKTEVITLSAQNWVNTTATDMYRINDIYVTTAGLSAQTIGNLTLSDAATNAKVFGYVKAGFTRARSSIYTVPASKTLYITQFLCGFAYQAASTEYARIITRATYAEGTRTAGVFYPYTETLISNGSIMVPLSIPTVIAEKVDIKVSILPTAAGGSGTVALRGWLE